VKGRPARLLAGLMLLLACGCGQKGALYLPDSKPESVTPHPATTVEPGTPAAPATPPADESSRRKAPSTPEAATTQ